MLYPYYLSFTNHPWFEIETDLHFLSYPYPWVLKQMKKSTNGETPEGRWPPEQTLKPLPASILWGASVRDLTQISSVTVSCQSSYETRGESLASVLAGSKGSSSSPTGLCVCVLQFCFALRWAYSLTGALHGLHVSRCISFLQYRFQIRVTCFPSELKTSPGEEGILVLLGSHGHQGLEKEDHVTDKLYQNPTDVSKKKRCQASIDIFLGRADLLCFTSCSACFCFTT